MNAVGKSLKELPYDPVRAAALHVDESTWPWLVKDAWAKQLTLEEYARKYGVVLSPSRALDVSRRGGDQAVIERAAQAQAGDIGDQLGAAEYEDPAWAVAYAESPDLDDIAKENLGWD